MTAVFHGSTIPCLRSLDSGYARSLYKNKPVIYGTKDYVYALVRAGRFGVHYSHMIREDYNGMYKPFELAELCKDAFKKTFYTPGSIYVLDDVYFELTEDEDEWITYEDKVPVFGEIIINNVWEEMGKYADRFRFIYYGTDEWNEYWKTVNGGLEGYLERSRLRRGGNV